ncbi:MAG: GNAT family N-acetyltransferase [Bacteroidales bacterium]|nr:GNAT family N-acetyltransferase [Bacteroidales bacterium]
MVKFEIIREEKEFKNINHAQCINFLHNHLDRFRDNKEDISKCIDYVMQKDCGKGGYLLLAYYEEELAGILVMTNTGMSGFIPENILVYIAVDAKFRGKGIGRKIIEKAISITEGNIKLHVEYDNPAKRLYERIGFNTKYAEMRFENKK